MTERPNAFCYEDSLIIAEKDRAIRDLRDLCNDLSREITALKEQVRSFAYMVQEYGDHQYNCPTHRADRIDTECSCDWREVYDKAKEVLAPKRSITVGVAK